MVHSLQAHVGAYCELSTGGCRGDKILINLTHQEFKKATLATLILPPSVSETGQALSAGHLPASS